jgi:hypothetical protein
VHIPRPANKKLQYAVLTAALHGGTEPGLLDEIVWWQTDDFWQYALFATVAHIRAAANRAGVPMPGHASNSPSARTRPAESGHMLQAPATERPAMRGRKPGTRPPSADQQLGGTARPHLLPSDHIP